MYETIAILFTWLVLSGVFVGIGLPVSRALRYCGPREEEHLSTLFWFGWAAGIVFLQVWHLVAPVAFSALAILMVVAFAGLVLDRGRLQRAIRSLPYVPPWSRALFIGFALWLANRAMGPLFTYDAGTYHLQSIQWNSSYPIVPGLGNLHVRLAFNSSHFLFLSLLNLGPWDAMPHHIGNGLLLLGISWPVFQSLLRVVPGSRRPFRPIDLFYTLMAPTLLWHCVKHASTTSPDLPVFVLGVLVAGRLFSVLFPDRETVEVHGETTFIVTMSAVGLCIKLSFLGLAASASLVALGVCLRRVWARRPPQMILPSLLLWAAVAGVALAPWAARSIILSGYVGYPVTAFPLPVEWKIPEPIAEDGARWISSWARQPEGNPSQVLGSRQWMRSWLERIARYHTFDVVLPIGLGLVFLPFAVSRFRKKQLGWMSLSLFLLPAAFSLLFWFATAPDPRFGGAAFWYFCAGSITSACYDLHPKRVFGSLCLLAVLAFSATVWQYNLIRLSNLIHMMPYSVVYPIPAARYHTVETASGLPVNVPDSGDQCWNAPIPCTPYPNAHLAWRDGSTMRSGFVLHQLLQIP